MKRYNRKTEARAAEMLSGVLRRLPIHPANKPLVQRMMCQSEEAARGLEDILKRSVSVMEVMWLTIRGGVEMLTTEITLESVYDVELLVILTVEIPGRMEYED